MPSSVRNLYALPSENPGVDRPGTGTEQRQGGTHASDHDPAAQASESEDVPQRIGRNQRSNDRRPQAGEQQNPQSRRERMKHGRDRRRPAHQRQGIKNDQADTGRQAQEQKPEARRTIGKRGEKATHGIA